MDLHRLQVEITAEIKKFKSKCDAVKAEARKTVDEANKSFSKIGSAAWKQAEQIRKQTENQKKKVKDITRAIQLDSGLIEPTKEYKALEKNMAAAEKRLESLVKKQASMPDKDVKTMTDDYAFCADKIKSAESRLDALIEKQIQWTNIGVDPNTTSFQELDAEIEDTNAELDRYRRKQKQLEDSGKAFLHTEKWKALQRDITQAREDVRGYKAEAESLDKAGRAYNPTAKMTENQQYKSWANAGTKYLGGIVSEAAKVHPAIRKLTELMQKFGTVSKGAGIKGKAAINAINTAAKLASWPMRMLASGFGKVYQKIKDGLSTLKQFTHHTNSMSNSCGKLLGKFGALRITATYMFASFMIMGGINAMKEGFKSLSQYSSRTNEDLSMLLSSLTQLRNALATAFAPILSVVAPILSTFIDWISAAMTAIAHFMAAITGKSQVVVARKANQDFAAGIADTGSAADSAADSVEKYKRSLMGFDQINKLDEQSTGSGGSGGSGGAGGGVSPSDMFETVEVESTFVDWAEKFKEAWENADFTEIGRIVGEKLNSALENIPWDKIKATSAKIAKSIATFLNGFIEATDWSLVGSTFAEGLNTIVEFGYSFVTNFSWSKFGTAIADAITGFFETLDLAKAGEALSEGIKGVLNTITTALSETDWNAIGQKVGDFLTSIDWLGVLAAVGKAIAAALVAVLDFAAGLFESICEGLQNMSWSDVAKTIWSLLKSAWDILDKIIEVAISLIKSGWSTLKNFVGDLVSVAVSLVKSGWSKLSEFIGEKVSVIVDRVKGWTSSLASWVGDRVSVTVSRVKSWSTSMSSWIGNRVSVTIRRVKGWSSSLSSWIGAAKAIALKFKLPRVGVRWGEKKVAGFTIKYPNGFYTYAKGGFPEEGPFFMNRGEIAGKFSNGKGVVANNQQITTGIANAVGPAVYRAVVSAMTMMGDFKGNVNIVLQGDAKGLFKVVREEAQNYTVSTGEAPFPV